MATSVSTPQWKSKEDYLDDIPPPTHFEHIAHRTRRMLRSAGPAGLRRRNQILADGEDPGDATGGVGNVPGGPPPPPRRPQSATLPIQSRMNPFNGDMMDPREKQYWVYLHNQRLKELAKRPGTSRYMQPLFAPLTASAGADENDPLARSQTVQKSAKVGVASTLQSVVSQKRSVFVTPGDISASASQRKKRLSPAVSKHRKLGAPLHPIAATSGHSALDAASPSVTPQHGQAHPSQQKRGSMVGFGSTTTIPIPSASPVTTPLSKPRSIISTMMDQTASSSTTEHSNAFRSNNLRQIESEYKNAKHAFEKIDLAKNYRITYPQYLAFGNMLKRPVDHNSFKRVDKEKSGYIDWFQALRSLYSGLSREEVRSCIRMWGGPHEHLSFTGRRIRRGHNTSLLGNASQATLNSSITLSGPVLSQSQSMLSPSVSSIVASGSVGGGLGSPLSSPTGPLGSSSASISFLTPSPSIDASTLLFHPDLLAMFQSIRGVSDENNQDDHPRGGVTYHELRKATSAYYLQDKVLEEMFIMADVDQDGELNVAEFAWLMSEAFNANFKTSAVPSH